VFKAENKFDHRIFAIKQIKINPREDLKKVLQEVENLSKVGKHKNIVKYLDCFLVQEEWQEDEEGDDESQSSSQASSSFSHHLEDDSSSFIAFHPEASSLRQTEGTEPSEARRPAPGARAASPGYSSTLTCICIKMEFCHLTLEQRLDRMRSERPLHADIHSMMCSVATFTHFKENKTNAKFGAFCPLYIINQLLEGLIFIHSLGIVHRQGVSRRRRRRRRMRVHDFPAAGT
jgi:serine/threonine protein kinase